jgi:hypothetical protein
MEIGKAFRRTAALACLGLLATPAHAQVVVPAGFAARDIASGPPLTGVSGLAASPDGRLFVSDVGCQHPSPDICREETRVPRLFAIDPVFGSGPTDFPVGMVLGWPARMLFGNGDALTGNDLILVDWNSHFGQARCCGGVVARIDPATGATTIISDSSAIPGLAFAPEDPFALAFAPGGAFGSGLYVSDIEGMSPFPPFIFRIDADGTRRGFANNPDTGLWGTQRVALDLAFATGGAFGTDLYVSDPSSIGAPPTIWRLDANATARVFVAGAPLTAPSAIRFAPGGAFGENLYVLDGGVGKIFKVSPDGTMAEFASGLPTIPVPPGAEPAPPFPPPDMQFVDDGKRLIVGIMDRIVEISTSVVEVAIDITPGGFPNSINPTSQGMIPVAVLSSPQFDAQSLDFASVRFGPRGTEAIAQHVAPEDVNGDGLLDAVFQFPTRAAGILCGATTLTLTARTLDGRPVTGTDSIRTVGCR